MPRTSRSGPEDDASAYASRFDGVRVPATDYRPVWLDSLR